MERSRTIAVLQALELEQLRAEIVRGLHHGLTAEEISEIILHTAFYAGFPTGMNASAVAGAVFEERGLSLPRQQGPWVAPQVEPQSRTSGGYAAVSRLGELRDVLLYGDVWERPQLSLRDRSLVTVAVLQALNRSELGGHLNRAMQNGVTEHELREVVLHVTFYAGWPQAVTAGGLLADLFEQQGIPLGGR
jgi:4-carboxymuconolactone decarboxylase